MLYRLALLGIVAFFIAVAPAMATELIANGSFETGTLAGWTPITTGPPFLPWQVTMAGQGGSYGLFTTQPQAGQFNAWNGFDGAGPMSFALFQEIRVPVCLGTTAALRWKSRVQWNFALTGNATLPRTLTAQVRQTGGTPPTTIYNFSTGTARVIGDTGWQSHTANLASFKGSTIQLWFEENIPEPFTGPGQFEIDAVSLDVTDFVGIDNNCTNVPNRVIDPFTGLTLAQLVSSLADSCTVEARNHGDFVNCISRGLNGLRNDILSGQQKGSITSAAALSARGKKY